MCELIPEAENCCYFISLRIGMLFISVLAITTGGITLSVIEQHSNVSYDNLKNVTTIRDPNKAFSHIGSLIRSGVTTMSVFFMLMGVVLLFGTLTNSEGMVQVFVWVLFLNIVFAFFLVIAICFECVLYDDRCIFGEMDWLSSSALLVLIITYLFLWIYFISVANGYVMNES
ncbi:uncharacterized protein LOC114252953 [Bombyx mandarina]|uniref:Uncharacterized protein n=2 Tax=Bombyx TaxID=7090 RepID=A0A8R2HQB8_BOMMO|nr:uncharacterized protein LOC101740351 [Bombyx mori]XP_028043453.1 uncharacterized protein LOC114252953 [Bombyx mandarina]